MLLDRGVHLSAVVCGWWVILVTATELTRFAGGYFEFASARYLATVDPIQTEFPRNPQPMFHLKMWVIFTRNWAATGR